MDPLDVGLLASTAIGVLGPYLADLAGKASNAFLDKAADRVAGGAYKATANLLELVKQKFSGNGEAEKNLELLTTAPADPSARDAVEKSLKAELERDRNFASALSNQLLEISRTEAGTAFVNHVQGNVNKIAEFGTVYGDVSF